MSEPVLSVSGLSAYYRVSSFGVRREVRAVDDVSLAVGPGEIYGLAGESSSGKTTLIKTIAAALKPPLQVMAGSVTFKFAGRPIDIHRNGPYRTQTHFLTRNDGSSFNDCADSGKLGLELIFEGTAGARLGGRRARLRPSRGLRVLLIVLVLVIEFEGRNQDRRQ